MALFQSSVLKSHLSLLNTSEVEKAYRKYVKYFLNPTIQDNIRSSKEEEYQGIFLTELFVNILDYTLKPKADFNLVAEYKNQNNSRKADGAILDDDIAVGVIELKGTKTKDLESIRRQAFDYKANQKGCVYVITSNFEKLRFYINDATEFEEFNLFELTQNRFSLLYLCLQKDNIITKVPLKIKEASVVVEEQITKQFYKDYSLFKRELYRDLVKRNAKQLKTKASQYSEDVQTEEEKAEQLKLEKNVKLTLFKKSQKLIDRYLFIFFAEDRGLLPPNSTQQILDKWKADIDFGDERPLYDLFKQYFNYLDTGRQGTVSRSEIYAYNGGLFKTDKTLDSLVIDNDLLFQHTSKLAAYDFESQVDVNILGHIFENSLNEIESVNAEIEGGDFDKQKSKRKKDGVFYTPKYITKYIVENTVGKLCDEKKIELGFKEEEYFKGRKNRNKTTITKLVTILDKYRDWLLQLTICDPACGSGAFLNQALDFLIKEHTYIDELKAKIFGSSIEFSDIENTILENNIYGVDLNEESVEIAKLSLWLRTAQPRRKLNDLSSNIKCGNSLIDSKTVAGDKAFNWQEQFPKVFAKGGFDVIIGNPPYVRIQNLDSKLVDFYFENYKSPKGKLDLSILFFEKLSYLLNVNGLGSFISSAQWMQTEYGENLRKIICQSKKLTEILDFGSLPVFDGVSTYPAIFLFNQNESETLSYKLAKTKSELNLHSIQNLKSIQIDYNKFGKKPWSFSAFDLVDFLKKNNIKYKPLSDFGKAYYGIVTGMDKAFIVNDEIVKNFNLESSLIFPFAYKGEEVKRYINTNPKSSVIYPYKINDEGEQELLSPELLKNKYPNIHNYLTAFKEDLEKRKDSRKLYATGDNWFSHVRQGNIGLINANKIQIRGISHNIKCGYLDSGNAFSGANCPAIILKEKFSSLIIMGIINSSLINYYLKEVCPKKLGGYLRYNTKSISDIPIIYPDCEEILKLKVIEISGYYNSKDKVIFRFKGFYEKTFNLESIPRKLENWHELEFGEFIKELNKAIKVNNKLRAKQMAETVISSTVEKSHSIEIPTLTKKDEFELLDIFEENKQKAQALQDQINQTDKEIDAMVYMLYGLTEEEIKIVENS